MKVKLNDEATRAERIRLGTIIKVRRRTLHIKQAVMASKLGISVTSYAKIERGASSVSFDRLIEICSILDMDLSSLEEKSSHNTLQYDALNSLYREIKALKNETQKFRKYLAGENCTVFIKGGGNTNP